MHEKVAHKMEVDGGQQESNKKDAGNELITEEKNIKLEATTGG